jgi:hypothetical protein
MSSGDFDSFGIMKIGSSEPEEFVIVFLTPHPLQGKPFMTVTNAFSEDEIVIDRESRARPL